MGSHLKNQQNEDLGTISNIVVNPQTGHIRYAVVNANGKKVTLPWSAINAQNNSGSDTPTLTANVTKDKLSNAPKFDSDNMQNLQSCGGRRALIVGSLTGDTRRGTRKADVVALLAGNDASQTRAGKDITCGGPGRISPGGRKGRGPPSAVRATTPWSAARGGTSASAVPAATRPGAARS